MADVLLALKADVLAFLDRVERGDSAGAVLERAALVERLGALKADLEKSGLVYVSEGLPSTGTPLEAQTAVLERQWAAVDARRRRLFGGLTRVANAVRRASPEGVSVCSVASLLEADAGVDGMDTSYGSD